MYITSEMIEDTVALYGQPGIISMEAEVSNSEFEFIKSTQKNDRAHDVTFYIFNGSKLIVNAKHNYPKGLYRAPSGGLKPGEGFAEGLKREAYEETGTIVEPDKFLLIINVTFIAGEKKLEWTSYIFRAKYISGDLKVIDTREIREVIWTDLGAFDSYKKIIHTTDIGGLHYRARLHDAVKGLL
jgi:ADP-ribose pyrophosphatase YjhB (NUDIX family)